MSEIIPMFNFALHAINLVIAVMIIPLIKFLFDLRLKIERIDIMLNMILKDVEKLKKEIWNGEKSED